MLNLNVGGNVIADVVWHKQVLCVCLEIVKMGFEDVAAQFL